MFLNLCNLVMISIRTFEEFPDSKDDFPSRSTFWEQLFTKPSSENYFLKISIVSHGRTSHIWTLKFSIRPSSKITFEKDFSHHKSMLSTHLTTLMWNISHMDLHHCEFATCESIIS